MAGAHSPRADILRSMKKRPLMDIHHLPAVASHFHVVTHLSTNYNSTPTFYVSVIQ
jgi:hypothetical protein